MTAKRLDAREQEYREEAERLASLPVETQRRLIAVYREVAGNPKLKKRDREQGTERADALERHLRRLNRRAKREAK